MKRKFSARYQAALRTHLKQGRRANLESARELGSLALAAGLQPLDLAKLHEQTLVTEVLPGCPSAKRAEIIKHAGIFFAAAIASIEKPHRSVRLEKFIEALSQRTVELSASNRELSLEIAQRKAAQAAPKKASTVTCSCLEQSDRLRMSREILAAHEEERKKISRELHDVIAQTLTGINIRLATLRKEVALNTNGLDRKIASTQWLVAQSVDIVHRFARELRPAMLDDLGLIPTLHAFMKGFKEETGIHVSLGAFAAVEQVNADKRTVIYRGALEALNNAARHSQASRVEVRIQKLDDTICMSIKDNGKGFVVKRVLHAKMGKRLGLLGMRERLEMVGGNCTIISAPGKGTTVQAEVPLANGHTAGW